MARMVLVISMVVLFAPAAGAVDGVLEINHACAVHTGCFSGDTEGYPVEITSPGGYRLTSNLIVPDLLTDGIRFKAPSVNLDLNGFSIVRAGCEDVDDECAAIGGTGSGVYGTEQETSSSSVRNGTITGMGKYGVYLAGGARVSGVTAKWNRLDGIHLYDGPSSITGCTAYRNGSAGFWVRHATVSNSSSYENGGAGFFVTESTLLGSAANKNTGTGISAKKSLVSGNTASNNSDDGVFAENSTISNNHSHNNTGYGLNLDEDSSYRGNTLTDNTNLGVFSGVDAGGNVCDGEVGCQEIIFLSK